MKRLFTWRYTIIIFIRIHLSNPIEPYVLDNYMSEHLDDIASIEDESVDDQNNSLLFYDYEDDDVDKNLEVYNNFKNDRDELSNNEATDESLINSLRNGPKTLHILKEGKKPKGQKEEEENEKKREKAEREKAEAKREQQLKVMYARHESKLKDIEHFAKTSSAGSKYLLYEVRRIQTTRTIIDPLRDMVEKLEDPVFKKSKAAVLECFKKFFSQIRLPVNPWKHDTNRLTIWHQIDRELEAYP